MSRGLLLVALVALVACSSSSPRTEAPATGSGSASSVGIPAAGCPATFQAARGMACSIKTPCMYPEGACSCTTPEWCGGMQPDPSFFKQPPSWQCRVGAGCPADAPPDGTACRPEGKACDYTCSCLQVSTCTKGAWKTRRGPCKP